MYGTPRRNEQIAGRERQAWPDHWNKYQIKGYRVCIPKERLVIVTQHVRNVETLKKAPNEQLGRSLLEGDETHTRLSTAMNGMGEKLRGKT